ncbi:hypothetical protein OPQ81_003422 [Rhizoctonia solani]|nr:hypothetical protein OPQ81_003422 [Rhizoctonia solani]
MDPPSTPSRPRQSAQGPPRRESTTSHRVTRSRAALQNNLQLSPVLSSSLSPPPPESGQQGDADHQYTSMTVPAETQSNNSITQNDKGAAATANGEQAPNPNASTSASTPKKRKIQAENEDDPNDGPLLSEYMCPICLSPPTGAIVTLCGHIISVQSAAPQFQTSNSLARLQLYPNVPPPPPPRRPLEPRTIANGRIRLPTAGEDMIDPNEQEVIDVDMDEEPQRPEPRWDPARSGVVGLEILTLGVDEVM